MPLRPGMIMGPVSGLVAVQWIPQTPTTHVCLTDNFTFGWNIVEQEETIVYIKWIFTPITSNTSVLIATYMESVFLISVAYRTRLTHRGQGVVVLSGVTPADTGTYTVLLSAKYATLETRRISRDLLLTVLDPATYRSKTLEMKMDQQAVLDANGEFHVQLTCGPLPFRGQPPIDVIWKTSSGVSRNSSSFKNGEFRLLLTNPPQGGVYSCRLPSTASAVMCLTNDDALLGESTLDVDVDEARVSLIEADAWAELEKLKSENKDLKQEVNLYKSLVRNLTELQLQGTVQQYKPRVSKFSERTSSMESELGQYRALDETLRKRLLSLVAYSSKQYSMFKIISLKEDCFSKTLGKYIGDAEKLTRLLQPLMRTLEENHRHVDNMTKRAKAMKELLTPYQGKLKGDIWFQAKMSKDRSVSSGDIVKFDYYYTNHGRAFRDGTFTAPVSGLYFFAFTITPTDYVHLDLEIENVKEPPARVTLRQNSVVASTTGHAIVPMLPGTHAYLKSRSNGGLTEYSMFTGFLVRKYL